MGREGEDQPSLVREGGVAEGGGKLEGRRLREYFLEEIDTGDT